MNLAIDKPNPKQVLFLKDTHRHVGFGGARGGGKSWAVRAKATILCLSHPGIKVMIVRRTYPELIANHIKPLREMYRCGSSDSIAKYNDSRKEMRFPNGSEIIFQYCATDKDLEHFQGTECDVLFIDEACNFTEDQIKKMNACVRGTNSFPKRTYYTCNPSGRGLQYIKRIFIDKVYEIGERAEDYSFIQSLVTDNYALMASDPEYIHQLEALPPKLREAWLNGRWDVFEGAFFEEFRATPDPTECINHGITVEEALEHHQWTHVIKPFDIPKGWKIYRSYDFGYGKPASLGWWAVDYDGIAYRILEYYFCTGTPNEGMHLSAQEQFKRIKAVENEHPWLKGKQIQGVADPAIWEGSHGISIAEEADKQGIWFQKGVNDRISGWMQVHERLKFDENGYAMMYFFEGCKAAIRTMPLMMYDEHKPEDLDTDLEDHACDEIRYFCMMRPIKPRMIQPKDIIYSDPLNQFTDTRYRQKAVIYRG